MYLGKYTINLLGAQNFIFFTNNIREINSRIMSKEGNATYTTEINTNFGW
jgi:hypothetical protein